MQAKTSLVSGFDKFEKSRKGRGGNKILLANGKIAEGIFSTLLTQRHRLLSPCGAQLLNGQAHRVSTNPCRLS